MERSRADDERCEIHALAYDQQLRETDERSDIRIDPNIELDYEFDLSGTYWPHIALGFPSNRLTDDFDSQHHYSTSSKAATTNACHTFSLEDSAPYVTATPTSQDDHQLLSQFSATCDFLLEIPSVESTTDESANLPMHGVMAGLKTAAVEGIDDSAQDDLQCSLKYQGDNLKSMDSFGLGLPEEIPNSLDASGGFDLLPLEEESTAFLSRPHQHQASVSTKTNVSVSHRNDPSSTRNRYLSPILDSGVENDGGYLETMHPEVRECNQCNTELHSIASLGKHASETGHAPFFCPEEGCGKAYSRFDVLERHQDIHRLDVTRYPCPHCRKYRGANGFKRKDHLTQHLRNYHHIGVDDVSGNSRSCPHEDCPEWRPAGTWGDQHAFQKGSDYITHIRKVHKESEFPCTEPGCDRTGPKGYFRMRDFQKHKLKAHGIPIE